MYLFRPFCIQKIRVISYTVLMASCLSSQGRTEGMLLEERKQSRMTLGQSSNVDWHNEIAFLALDEDGRCLDGMHLFRGEYAPRVVDLVWGSSSRACLHRRLGRGGLLVNLGKADTREFEAVDATNFLNAFENLFIENALQLFRLTQEVCGKDVVCTFSYGPDGELTQVSEKSDSSKKLEGNLTVHYEKEGLNPKIRITSFSGEEIEYLFDVPKTTESEPVILRVGYAEGLFLGVYIWHGE